MNRKEISIKLAEYIKALTGFSGEIKDTTGLAEMEIDSISLVKIFVFIERNFGISLLDSGVTKKEIETFGAIVNYISGNM